MSNKRILEGIEPAEVFRYFEEIASIPRPSGREKKISDYLIHFAETHGFEHYRDALNNVIIIKEASEGYERQEPIILQGHMDMVCEKDPGVHKDMNEEGLDLEVDGDFIFANGTTLGGDDGIAVAYALALLDSDTLKHPRLECVITVGEEVGMDGAKFIDCSPLKGHLLLNLDSEKEGVVLAGCAGGATEKVILPIKREAFDGERVAIHVSGLTGGHSGTEIHKGRANAMLVLIRTIMEASRVTDVRLLSITAGSKDNAIPREATAIAAVKDYSKLRESVLESEKNLQKEYRAVDPGLRVTAEKKTETSASRKDADPLTVEDTHRVIALVNSLPSGVQRMSDAVEGLTETSLNWGITELSGSEFTMCASVRSSVSSALAALIQKINWIAGFYGAHTTESGAYPPWEWVEHSELRNRMSVIYREMFGKELVIEAIHAGVECGLLAGKINKLDAVSMGPDIFHIHTPQERLSISSAGRMYEYIRRIIEYK